MRSGKMLRFALHISILFLTLRPWHFMQLYALIFSLGSLIEDDTIHQSPFGV